MGFFVLLAVEAGAISSELAEATGEGGFGLNFNLLETNLINLAIVIGLLVYLGRKFLGGILADRTSTIEAAIRAAEERRKDAAAALAEEQQKLAQAQAEAERIRASAEEAAKAAREAILAQAERDVQRVRETAVQDINTEQERAILELRRRVAALALQRVESQLAGNLNESAQQRLIDRSIATLGGR
ncbi:ATP synthase F0 subunit B [Leptolyngbya sp. 'hensonii']|uniref:F0F1 ATP synthase subunit B n=1 Tax=Leptolyngbya sp. 'hensonii' TaxID=1922337 RepID=UPI0009501227|nr:F0F1 ATP synthase subunit B [Leptolyngbya sp. 'hensonii']OLP15368.1 ATP synthase F0 subunit B [Leptolyngbya sp. 'hensonii']